MTGAKTNERPGTRAQARYVRSSAYKAREILDLIRGKSYAAASEILDFSERAIARDIKKVLDSAVANAEHNDGLVAEELYVAACYADEGPTLKRWRPRARGRASRIRKRTCHITVIVARYDEAELDLLRAREENRGRSGSTQAAEARRRRVEQSRQRAEERARAAEEAEAADEADETEHTEATDDEAADETEATDTGADEPVDTDEAATGGDDASDDEDGDE
ncbi:MAG: 50S ribosomal protein L22 [Actinomyces sp.]|nr:MAG: 50S ribosomal protein L22 [Actinomyces sp.]